MKLSGNISLWFMLKMKMYTVGVYVCTLKKKTEAVVVTSKEDGL